MSPDPGKLDAVVVAAVLVGDAVAEVPETIDRVRRQVYEIDRVVVVGSGADGRVAADNAGVEWMSTVPNLLGTIEGSVTHFWFIRAGALPRPDALGALVGESLRSDAAVAGSKLVRNDEPERLVAVGIATDVFDVPYLGLEEEELDAGQYDVVRDVAAVAGVSMLIRRDLARGVGGPDPVMPPEAAAIDLCQRARLRGARVVVVPSSEVLFDAARVRAQSWREDAGQIRAMLKAYSLLTLIWAIPLRFLIGLVEAIVSPFIGRWTAFGWLRCWLWNLVHLPSLLRGRAAARRGRASGDAELYRFQMRGSATLSDLWQTVGGRMRARLDRGEGLDLASIGAELRQPAFVVGTLTVLVSLGAVRALWSNGWPAVGYVLPLPQSGAAAVGAYAGGWNPAGFGSPEQLPPLIGLAGVMQVILFNSADRAAWAISLIAVVSGIWGTIRLLRIWGVEVVAAWAGGIVLVAGPAAQALGNESAVGQLLAVGILPWAIGVAAARWPRGWRRRLGRVAAVAWVTGLVGIASPPMLVVPVAVLALRALLRPASWRTWRAMLVSAGGTLIAIPLLLPWAWFADLERFFSSGSIFWEPNVVVLAAAGVAFVAALMVTRRDRLDAVVLGGVVAGLGAILGRGSELSVGRELSLAGIGAASLGLALVVAAGLDALRSSDVRGWRRLFAGIGALGAIALVASSFLPLVGGRGTLPGDQFSDALRFTAAAEGDATASRILLIGPADTLPGDSRRVRGASYRVVSAPVPSLWEVNLPEAHLADAALESTLLDLIEGTESRAGAALAHFGIRWVVATGDTPLEAIFAGQLDLVPLGGAQRPTFLVDAVNPVRAVTGDGVVWSRAGTGYDGPEAPGDRVFVAENANTRWGPDWVQSGWGSEVSAATGEARFTPIPARRSQASMAAGLFVFLVLVSTYGRRRR
jgi:hypothetical protein